MLHVPYRGIENEGVVVVSDCLFYCLIDRLLHQRIVLAVGELPDDESAQIGEHTTHAQVAHHAVNMVVPLANILDEQDRFLNTDN